VSPPIHPLTSSQGAVFLINSRQAYFSCGLICIRQALLLTYSCFFAEFLEDLSLVRLTLLELITCVGLRYGFYVNKFRSFSRERAQYSPPRRTSKFILRSNLPLKVVSGFSWRAFSRHKRKSNYALYVQHSVTPSLNIKVREY
jgi:hypothetical protein